MWRVLGGGGGGFSGVEGVQGLGFRDVLRI